MQPRCLRVVFDGDGARGHGPDHEHDGLAVVGQRLGEGFRGVELAANREGVDVGPRRHVAREGVLDHLEKRGKSTVQERKAHKIQQFFT